MSFYKRPLLTFSIRSILHALISKFHCQRWTLSIAHYFLRDTLTKRWEFRRKILLFFRSKFFVSLSYTDSIKIFSLCRATSLVSGFDQLWRRNDLCYWKCNQASSVQRQSATSKPIQSLSLWRSWRLGWRSS